MIESEKREFVQMMETLAGMYGRELPVARMAPYWEALKHIPLCDVKSALNAHTVDENRGRFFPLPADVVAKLPNGRETWPDANEAWAMVPKDEYSSAAMCDEMAEAYAIASDLVVAGDMVAARMAFIAAYNRAVDDAVAVGSVPRWFASYGDDKSNRALADRDIVRMRNRALPPSDRMAIPDMRNDEPVSLEHLTEKMAENVTEPEKAKENISKILGMLGKQSEDVCRG